MTISVVVFDVNETLSDMTPIAGRFSDVGAPRHLARVWFSGVLRDGFALTAAGAKEKFTVLAEGGLRTALAGMDLDLPVEQAARHIMDGFADLPVHPDVAPAVRALREKGLRLVTLTNGSVAVADRLLSQAGVRGEFEQLMSVEDAPAWKPSRAAYAHAADRCGVGMDQMLMVAVHPWDIDGALRAGLAAGWVNRDGALYPGYFRSPTITGATIGDIAALLPEFP